MTNGSVIVPVVPRMIRCGATIERRKKAFYPVPASRCECWAVVRVDGERVAYCRRHAKALGIEGGAE